MLHGLTLRLLGALGLCLLFSPAFAQQSIRLSLLNPEPLKIELSPDGLDALSLGEVYASLGGYDVSSLLSYQNNAIYFHHDGAIEAGDYVFRIEVIRPDSVILLSTTNLTFYQPEWTGRSQFSGAGSYELDASQNESFAQNIQRLSESALRLQAQRLGKETRLNLVADIQHRSDANTLSREHLEIPNFLIEVQRKSKIGSLEFSLGNQLFEENSLVFNGFNRRGIGAKIVGNQKRYKLNTFIINTDPEVSSKDNVLIAGSNNERSYGGIIEFSPFKENSDRLNISSGYIDGRSELQGIGLSYGLSHTEDEPISYGGSTWFLAASSRWFDQSINVQLEQARSSVDSDGFGVGLDEREDSASRFSISLNSQGRLGEVLKLFNTQYWQAHFLKQKVGAHFYSFANLGLPGDMETEQGRMQLSWTELNVSIAALSIVNNIDDLETVPTQSTDQTQLAINYSPGVPMEETFWAFIGRPSFSFQYGETQRDQPLRHALLVGYDVDDKTTDLQLSANFQSDKHAWSFQYGKTKFNNNALTETPGGVLLFPTNPSTVNTFTSIAFNYFPDSNISVSPTVQHSSYKDLGVSGGKQGALNVGLQANFSLLKESLDLSVIHNLSKQKTEFGGAINNDYQSQQSSLAINWLAVKAKNRNAGFKISLKGSWNEQESSFQQRQNGYQVLLGMEMYWAAGVQ